MQSIKPARHSQAPEPVGATATGTSTRSADIHQLTVHGIHETFVRDLIARPLGMEDFRYDEERKDGWMVPEAMLTAPGLSVSDVGGATSPVSA